VVTLPGATSNKRSGFGDVAVTLGYSLDFGTSTWLDTSARVKLPTASTAKRLGTGKVDVTVGADLGQDIGNASIYVGGRRRFIGKAAGSTLRDVWALGGGLSYRLPGGTIIGADYDWQQSARLTEGPSSEVTGWINFGLSRKLRLQLFGSTGFTTNSADFAGGISLSFRLN
jgi:opacity protein-like surface antigen